MRELERQLPEAAFVIPGDTPNEKLNEDYWVTEVKDWLARLALRRSGGDEKKAAGWLGKHRKTVHERIRRGTD